MAHLAFIAIFFSLLINLSNGNPRTDFLHRTCGAEPLNNFSEYESNLSKFLELMAQKAGTHGFVAGEEGKHPNRVYALMKCMDDLTVEDCRICFAKIKTFLPACFPAAGARVFLDGCFMRIDNYNFFGEFISCEDKQRCSDNKNKAEQHTKSAAAVVDDVIKKALSNKGYANVRHTYYGLTLYAMANCWNNIDSFSCKTCLTNAKNLALGCLPSVEARALTAGCFLRYSDYDFADKYHTDSGVTDETILYLSCVLGAVAVCLLAIVGGYVVGQAIVRRQYNQRKAQKGLEIDSFHFKYTLLEKATHNFNTANKIGRGGFGEVFKGTLGDGREIAIKRLYLSGKLQFSEVQTEVYVIGKAQHKNLVRYLGCCFTKEDSLLVYEFLPNRSLDLVLFDPEKKGELGWKKRVEIIRGTAEGLEYLHKDCKHRIIHRDIKASNILLDLKHRPKISDFGLAMFDSDDHNHATSSVAGTLGYMAPEYLAQGILTEKADVYSYGILLLEIVSGVQNNNYQAEDSLDTLVTSTWKHFQENRVEEIMDKSAGIEEDIDEAKRVIQIGLLCTQELPSARPTMTTVIKMLDDKEFNLPNPSKPPFLVDEFKLENPNHSLR